MKGRWKKNGISDGNVATLPLMHKRAMRAILFDSPLNYIDRGAWMLGGSPNDAVKSAIGMAFLSGIGKLSGLRTVYGIQYDERLWKEKDALKFWDDNKDKIKWVKGQRSLT